MWCTRLAGNTGCKNRHLCTIAQICCATSQLRHASTTGKKLVKQQYLLHMSPLYGELQPTNGWDLLASLGHPSKFQRVLRLAFLTAATSLTGSQPNFARCLTVSWAATLYIHFRGLLSTDLRPSLAFSYIVSVCTPLQQRASAKLCGVVKGMELRNFRRGRHLYLAGRP